MSRRVIFSVALTVWALGVLAPADGLAQSSWAVAERTDEQIDGLAQRLLPFVDQVPGGTGAAAVILYAQTLTTFDDPMHKMCRNRMIMVRDFNALPERFTAPPVGDADRVETASAFVWRNGTIVSRPTVEFEEGPEDIGVDRAAIDWGVVEEGDVIGYSTIISQQEPYMAVVERAADLFPTVYMAISVDGADQYAYEPHWHGIEADELQIKEEDSRDGRPMTVKINARARVAYEDPPRRRPFPRDYPHVALVLEELYVDPDDSGFVQAGWLDMTGWNNFAAQSAAAVAAVAEDTDGLDITLSAITTGKKTEHEKAAAITAWVRDDIELLEGPMISESSVRDELRDVVRERQGTEVEKIMLAAVMMEQADVPVTIARFRDPALGPLDEDWEHFIQITDSVLRVDADGEVRYYAPQCAGCEPGTIPAAWTGVQALVYDYGLAKKAEAFQKKIQGEAAADGAINLAALRERVAGEDWARFETLQN